MFLALEGTHVSSMIGIGSVGISLATAFVLLPKHGITGPQWREDWLLS